jgi:heptosyltransferase-2
VRTGALGDVVLATALLAPLRARFPGARLEWLTEAPYVPLLAGLPELAAVHPLWRPGRGVPRPAPLRGFDLALDLQGRARTAALARAAAADGVALHAPERDPRAAVRALFAEVPPLPSLPARERYAEALAPLGLGPPGPTRVSAGREAVRRAEALLAGLPPGRRRVAVAPGARWASKRWPAARFAALADALGAGGHAVVLAGGPPDVEVLAPFRAALTRPLAADLSAQPLEVLAAALARVDLLVSNDSGLAHVAAAAGTPVLALFGPTSPERWGPPPPGRALSLGLGCAPCSDQGTQACPLGHHRCLGDLAVESVLGRAGELLGP